MTRPVEPEDAPPCPADGHATDCPRCRALEDRVAALEAEVDALRAGGPGGPPASPTGPPRLDFRALRLMPFGWGEGWGLRPSPSRRLWMDHHPHAYHCLPLVIANQWGWQVLCPADVRVTWDGRPGPEGVRVEVAPQYEPAIKSQFGEGIVTFSPPWLFRTPPGWDLYLKGPSNRWKPGAHPLEGIVETWWLNYTFTINWKLVEPGTIAFARGESLGQLVPVPHATFDDATATEVPIGLAEPEAARELVEWFERRRQLDGQDRRVHLLYRKAEGIEEHLREVGVPEIRSIVP